MTLVIPNSCNVLWNLPFHTLIVHVKKALLKKCFFLSFQLWEPKQLLGGLCAFVFLWNHRHLVPCKKCSYISCFLVSFKAGSLNDWQACWLRPSRFCCWRWRQLKSNIGFLVRTKNCPPHIYFFHTKNHNSDTSSNPSKKDKCHVLAFAHKSKELREMVELFW